MFDEGAGAVQPTPAHRVGEVADRFRAFDVTVETAHRRHPLSGFSIAGTSIQTESFARLHILKTEAMGA
jgi:hypothetical protein